MKNKIFKYSFCLLAAAAFSLTACESDDDYTPGEPTAANSVGAYFNSSNSSTIILTPEESSFTLTVSRTKTADAVTVPLVVEKVDTAAIEIPTSVSFAAGEATQDITVSCKGLTAKKQYGFTVKIGEEAADHYTIVDGTSEFKGSVVVSSWEKLKSVKIYSTDVAAIPASYSDLYQLDGVNQFYLKNFMGSGTDLYFTISGTDFDVNNVAASSGEIVPFKGAETVDYSSYKENYILTSAADGYSWTTDGVNYSYFMWYGGYDYNTYSWIDFSQSYIYMSAYISSDVYEGYASVYGVW